MSAADLVVCRAGATTLAELTAAGKPAVLIPLPTAADDHQRKNAEVLAARRRGGGDRAEGPVRRRCSRSGSPRSSPTRTGASAWQRRRGRFARPRRRARDRRSRAGTGAAVSAVERHDAADAARPQPDAVRTSWMLGRTRRVHFVGIGGIGMSGIAELLANLGYEVTGSDAQGIGRDRAARTTRRARARSGTTPHTSAPPTWSSCRRRSARTNPEMRRGAPPAHPGDSARRDARRADAAALRHRHRRRARQDHHDVDGGAGAGARRARSDRGDRRPAERLRQQRPARTRRSRWSSRRTKATVRSSSSRRRSRWSPTSTASTWTPTAAGRR